MYVSHRALFLCLFMATMGGSAAAWLILMPMPMQPGDVVSFAGSVLGAALTVLGALMVVEWQSGSDRRRRIELVASLLDGIRVWSRTVRASQPAGELSLVQMAMINVNGLIEAIDRAKSAIHWVVPDDLGMAVALGQLAQMHVDRDGIRKALTPITFYDGTPDFDPHLLALETRVEFALRALGR